MHRPNAAKTAILNSASIMFPSIESRLPFEGLICRAWEIFPVADSASDDHHSLALFGNLAGAAYMAAISGEGANDERVKCRFDSAWTS